MQGCAVALDGGFEFQALALGEDSDAMIAECTAEDNFVAGPGLIATEPPTVRNEADTGGINQESVPLALFDDLGVAADDLDTSRTGGLLHGIDNTLQLVERQ